VEWLNYHHLLYFWRVAREGHLTRASRELHLTPQTVSAQVRALEEALGEPLFERKGRRLVLTETGRTVYGYAEEIFGLGRELLETVRGRPTGRPLVLTVGVADVMPKHVAHRILQAALETGDPVRLVCREDRPDALLAALAVHELDVVLSDAPIPAGLGVRAFNHLLGETGVTFLAAPTLAGKHRRGFPDGMDGAPFLLPTGDAALRRSLDQWFSERRIRPRIVGEFQDSALLKVFGQAGQGIFVAPTVVADEVRLQHGVRVIGRTDEVVERFYAISPERRVRHPAVAAVCDVARREMFGAVAEG